MWMTLLGRLIRDSRGAAAVQFAVLAPALLLMVIGSFEVAILLFVSGTMELAVLAASRAGITGFTEEGVSREERIRDVIVDRTLGFVDMDRRRSAPSSTRVSTRLASPSHSPTRTVTASTIPGEAFNDVNGNGEWDDDMGAAGLGGPGDIVLYDIEYETGAVTRLFEPIFGRSRAPCGGRRAQRAVRAMRALAHRLLGRFHRDQAGRGGGRVRARPAGDDPASRWASPRSGGSRCST